MRPSHPANSHSLAASTPADTRIYAVGDIHGRADLLTETIIRIDEDIRRRPIQHVVEIYLGDYIDRGPDSKAVIDQLAVRMVENHAVCLRGNHEALMEEFLRDAGAFPHRHDRQSLYPFRGDEIAVLMIVENGLCVRSQKFHREVNAF